jgi:hypothetical protein
VLLLCIGGSVLVNWIGFNWRDAWEWGDLMDSRAYRGEGFGGRRNCQGRAVYLKGSERGEL